MSYQWELTPDYHVDGLVRVGQLLTLLSGCGSAICHSSLATYVCVHWAVSYKGIFFILDF